MFAIVSGVAVRRKLISGMQVGGNATLLEANAAMKPIVRRDTDEDWKVSVKRLMQEEGVSLESSDHRVLRIRSLDIHSGATFESGSSLDR